MGWIKLSNVNLRAVVGLLPIAKERLMSGPVKKLGTLDVKAARLLAVTGLTWWKSDAGVELPGDSSNNDKKN
jgi:hypothetical protein